MTDINAKFSVRAQLPAGSCSSRLLSHLSLLVSPARTDGLPPQRHSKCLPAATGDTHLASTQQPRAASQLLLPIAHACSRSKRVPHRNHPFTTHSARSVLGSPCHPPLDAAAVCHLPSQQSCTFLVDPPTCPSSACIAGVHGRGAQRASAVSVGRRRKKGEKNVLTPPGAGRRVMAAVAGAFARRRDELIPHIMSSITRFAKPTFHSSGFGASF